MGKTRKSKVRRPKVNPLGIPSLREIEQSEDLFNDDGNNSYPGGPIQAIADQLQSSHSEEKMNALQSMATLSLNEEKAKLISANNDIVRTVSPLLMDLNPSIRNATAGALRNLSMNGVTVCENLVEKDILTPLLTLLTEYANLSPEWSPCFDKNMKNQLDERSDTFLHAINILWNLCESTPIALDNFNQSQLLPSFLRCLNHKVFGTEIAISVAQCILVISEDNSNSWCILNQHISNILDLLFTTVEENNEIQCLLRTLAASILSNIPALFAAHSNQILTTVTEILDINHRTILGQITSKIPLHGYENDNADESDSSHSAIAMDEETEEDATQRRRKQDLPTDIDCEIKKVGYLLQAQRIVCEIITNLCSSDEEQIMDTKDDDDSENESVQDYDASNDGGSSTNLQNVKLPIEILEAIKTLGLIEKLWFKAQPIAENVNQILHYQSKNDLSKKLESLRVAALLCLQNLCNVVDTEDLGGPKALYSVWLDLGQQVFQGQQNSLIIEASTSLMRAAIEHLKSNPELFAQMTDNDLQLMLNGVKNCSISEIRANWLRMLGILGSVLQESLVRIIIQFILEICIQEYDVWTLSEAIDALMDMFSDNDWNQIVYDLNLQQKLKQLENIFKTKIRQQKRELNERYPAVLTVQDNLKRFGKYIENQMKNYKPPTVN